MPEQTLSMSIPILLLLLALYGLFTELWPRYLMKRGSEALATVVSVDHTVAFGLRGFLAAFAKKSEKDRTFGCDYIVTLRYTPEGGEELTVQTAVRARMRVLAGKRVPYLVAGDAVPIRYLPRFPKRLIVMLDEVVRLQKEPYRLVAWGISVVLMLAILVMFAVG